MAQPALGAPLDLGLGAMLNAQRDDFLTEEERKKRLGMASKDILGAGLGGGFTGFASTDLGMASVRR